jgi:hypothetical protein
VHLSRIADTIVLIVVFVPALIAALEALWIDTISRRATDMLGKLLAAVPNIFAAGLILVIAWYVAKFAAGLLSQLLASLGADALPEKVGRTHLFSGRMQPSPLAATLVMFFAMLFATVEAASQLEFEQVRDVVTTFIQFGGDVLFGGAILVIGFWLANLAYEVIVRAASERQSGLARIAHMAILGLVMAMGLRAMGIAADIVNLAFALTFGAVAVAVALSFGLGGREAAGRQMEYWLSKLRKQAWRRTQRCRRAARSAARGLRAPIGRVPQWQRRARPFRASPIVPSASSSSAVGSGTETPTLALDGRISRSRGAPS